MREYHGARSTTHGCAQAWHRLRHSRHTMPERYMPQQSPYTLCRHQRVVRRITTYPPEFPEQRVASGRERGAWSEYDDAGVFFGGGMSSLTILDRSSNYPETRAPMLPQRDQGHKLSVQECGGAGHPLAGGGPFVGAVPVTSQCLPDGNQRRAGQRAQATLISASSSTCSVRKQP